MLRNILYKLHFISLACVTEQIGLPHCKYMSHYSHWSTYQSKEIKLQCSLPGNCHICARNKYAPQNQNIYYIQYLIGIYGRCMLLYILTHESLASRSNHLKL